MSDADRELIAEAEALLVEAQAVIDRYAQRTGLNDNEAGEARTLTRQKGFDDDEHTAI
jgi:hypothetical protein